MERENLGERTRVLSGVHILVAEWLQWLEHTKGASHGTVRLYRRVMERWLERFDNQSPDLVTTQEIERWLQRPRYGRAKGNAASAATQRRDASCVRGFYAYHVARGNLCRDPTALVTTPSVRNVQPRPLCDETWQKLWAEVDGPDAIALGLGFFCGLRREELTKLRVSHVDLGGRRLVNFVRKGGGEDVLPIGTMLDVFERRLPHLDSGRLWPLVADCCERRRGDDWLLGWSDLGRPRKRMRTDLGLGQLDPQHMNHWLDRLTARSGVGHLHPHRLRHSAATNLLRSGVPLAIVSSLLNHSNVQTTMRYLKTGGNALGEWLATSNA